MTMVICLVVSILALLSLCLVFFAAIVHGIQLLGSKHLDVWASFNDDLTRATLSLRLPIMLMLRAGLVARPPQMPLLLLIGNIGHKCLYVLKAAAVVNVASRHIGLLLARGG